jgi:hypothetical protein
MSSTADDLHRQAEIMREFYGGGPDAEEKVRRELQTNRLCFVETRLATRGGHQVGVEPVLGRRVSEVSPGDSVARRRPL